MNKNEARRKASCGKCDCIYFSNYTFTCDYFLLRGVRRGCPVTDCDKYSKSVGDKAGWLRDCSAQAMFSPKKKRLTKNEQKKVTDLYNQGLTDADIGRQLRIPWRLIADWRNTNKLPSNYFTNGVANEI